MRLRHDRNNSMSFLNTPCAHQQHHGQHFGLVEELQGFAALSEVELILLKSLPNCTCCLADADAAASCWQACLCCKASSGQSDAADPLSGLCLQVADVQTQLSTDCECKHLMSNGSLLHDPAVYPSSFA